MHQLLEIHHEWQQEERQAAGTNWTDNCLVFTTPQGRPLDPTDLTRRFRRLLQSAGLRPIRFHDLRHSTATLLMGPGTTPPARPTTDPPQPSSADIAVSVAVKHHRSPVVRP
ncbi:hypothetical protein GCM10010400_26900 [Streptomyces aculeolatus]